MERDEVYWLRGTITLLEAQVDGLQYELRVREIRLAEKDQYRVSPETLHKLQLVIGQLHNQRDESFGNARAIRNLYENALSQQALRLMKLGRSASVNELNVLQPEDIALIGE